LNLSGILPDRNLARQLNNCIFFAFEPSEMQLTGEVEKQSTMN
jgi:hypothetical protein